MFVKMGIQLKWEMMLLPPVDENAAVVLPSTAFAVLLNPPSCRHVDDSWHKACALYHNMKTLWLWLKLLYFKETDAYLSVKFVFDASATSNVYMRYLFTVLYCAQPSVKAAAKTRSWNLARPLYKVPVCFHLGSVLSDCLMCQFWNIFIYLLSVKVLKLG